MSILSIQACSDKGIKRSGNEDMISINGILVRDSSYCRYQSIDDEGVYYYLIADGMGGHEKGEYASEYTLNHIGRNIGSMTDFEKDFSAVTQWISRDLNKIASEEDQSRPMGNTLTGIVWNKGKIWVVNIGDSRTYRLRAGLLKQLTEDQDINHKYGTDMGAQGLALYNAIGGGCGGVAEVADYSGRVLDGDTILICSDGLTDMVDDKEIERILSVKSENYATNLVHQANLNGGEDNISVVVIHIYNEKDFPLVDAMKVVEDHGVRPMESDTDDDRIIPESCKSKIKELFQHFGGLIRTKKN